MAAITVTDLVVEYPGLRALDRVNFELPGGSVTALVGPNGAGKTTLMRCLVALDQPFSGTVNVMGFDTQEAPREVHRQIGYLADNFGLYDDLSVARCLDFAARSHHLEGAARTARVATLIAQIGLESLVDRRAGTLSRGERQRAGLAIAMMHDPPILVLDEPASGLDPAARHHISALMQRLRAAGKTVLVSSHILAELEDYSDWMLTIDRGTVRAMVPVSERATTTGVRYLRMRLDSDGEAAQAALTGFDGVADFSIEGAIVDLSWTRNEAAQADLIAHLVGRGVRIVSLEVRASRMQDVYMAQVANPPAGSPASPSRTAP